MKAFSLYLLLILSFISFSVYSQTKTTPVWVVAPVVYQTTSLDPPQPNTPSSPASQRLYSMTSDNKKGAPNSARVLPGEKCDCSAISIVEFGSTYCIIPKFKPYIAQCRLVQ